RPPLGSGRGQRSHGQLAVEVLGDLRLGLGGLLPEKRVEALELGVYPGRVHRRWHRRHRLAGATWSGSWPRVANRPPSGASFTRSNEPSHGLRLELTGPISTSSSEPEFAQWRAMSGGALDQCSPQAYWTTARNRSFPARSRLYASPTCSLGNTSIIGLTSPRATIASASARYSGPLCAEPMIS